MPADIMAIHERVSAKRDVIFFVLFINTPFIQHIQNEEKSKAIKRD